MGRGFHRKPSMDQPGFQGRRKEQLEERVELGAGAHGKLGELR